MASLWLDVFVEYIAPHAFDTFREALNVMLVCKRVHQSAMRDMSFWRPWLRAFSDDSEGNVRLVRIKYFGTTWHLDGVVSVLRFTPWQFICSSFRWRSLSGKCNGDRHFCTWEEGQRIEGLWNEGGEVSMAVVWTFCGVCVMPYREGCWDGFGRIRWLCGLTWEGHMKRWRRHGWGVFTLVDGTILEGQWENDACAHLTIRRPRGSRDTKGGAITEELTGTAEGGVSYGFDLEESFVNVTIGEEKLMVTQARGILEALHSSLDD